MNGIRNPYWNLAGRISCGAIFGGFIGTVYFYFLIVTCKRLSLEFKPTYGFPGLETVGAPFFGLIASAPMGGLFELCVWLKARGLSVKRARPSLFHGAVAAVAIAGGLFTGISCRLMEVVVRAYYTGRFGNNGPSHIAIQVMGIDVFLVGYAVGFVMFGWCAWMFLRLPGELIVDTVPGTHSSDPDNPYSVGSHS